ncbi:AraC family transcriptional regulator [Loktanella sp. D2R18]|uniref:helix-turn-helix transcriptional regulator n=1 Tax=Rhodobacterales TaxID=204455 RepID=UPI000DEB4C03|nr:MULTISPECIES: helix-turn-helix domain-containing protein [Rhodobacterales]MDO6591048.1 AraC family transcriptional regulator [Yoonia sp. 1_MG-2023]RBW42200.1 AraC family transcriptional regulator [Loktanella sp. D2R18]
MANILRYKDILHDGAQIHLTRATLTSQRPKALHSHDFFEAFWVQNGQVRHHTPDRITTLHEGDLCCLQPGQTHALQGRGEHALVVSLCIHPATITALADRHPDLNGHLFWADTPLVQHHRDIRQLATLNHAAVALERSDRSALQAEAFLLPLCADLTADRGQKSAPAWLNDASHAAKDPDVFRQGAAGFVALTGKAHPHVSRTMRKYYGQTPSDFVNSLRMAHAARALITDSDPISVIAADVGIPNMSHFHKLFRATHRLTPLQYRQSFQRQLVQPQT